MERSGPPPGHVRIARIGRSHGLAGAMRVQPEAAGAIPALELADAVWIEGLGDAEIVRFEPHGRDFLLELDRVRRVETAKRLVHAGVFVAVPATGDDLDVSDDGDDGDGNAPDPLAWIGRPVRHGEREIGTIEEVVGSPLQPLLRLRGPAGEVLLPALAPYVRPSGEAVELIDPPDGLLDSA